MNRELIPWPRCDLTRMVTDLWPIPPFKNSTFTGCDLRSLCLIPMIGAANGTYKQMKLPKFE